MIRPGPFLAAAFATLAVSRLALSHAPDSYGLGSRGAALASAQAADARDFTAVYYNPAALASVPGLSLTLGYQGSDNMLQINGRDNNVADVHGLTGGFVAPGKILGIPFAFGFAAYLPDDGLSRVKALRQETPRWELYNDRNTITFISAALAIRPFSFLEIGGGIAFLAATRGSFGIRGTADIVHVYESKLEHEVDADLTSIRYPHLGIRGKVLDWGFVGLTYRGESKLPLSIDARLAGQVDAGLLVPLLYTLESRTIDAFLPQQVVLGLSLQKIANLTVNVDLTWVNWSAYESPTAKTLADLQIDAPAGLGLEIPDAPKPVDVIPPRFEDRVVPRLGVEYALPLGAERVKVHDRDVAPLVVPLRVGYVYEASPVPPQTGLTNFVDSDRHTVSLGAGLHLAKPFSVLSGTLRLDAHAEISVLPERRVEKTSPADFVGDYRAQGLMVGGGGNLGVEF